MRRTLITGWHVTAALALALLLAGPGRAAAAVTAAVAMPDRHAADAAEGVLRDGGNAVDAAVSAAFVLAVTYPEAGNIGGGGFATLYIDDEAAFLDFRERAPLAAQPDMYLDGDGGVLERATLVGARAAGVPGTVHGLASLHARYGALPWPRLLAPAIRLAREGFEVPPSLAELAAETSDFFAGETNFDAHFAGLKAGEIFVQPALAATLARLADDPRDFYSGETAALITAQMRRDGGLITGEDLAAYRSSWRPPLRREWRDLSIIAPPPPSSGGIALLQLLAMRDARDDLFRAVAHNSADYVHRLAELEKRVFADRARYLGDPDFVAMPVAQLLDPGYLKRRAESADARGISAAESYAPVLEPTQTTHFSVVDGAGNAVSLTYTLNWDFGNGVVVEGAGFLLNNEMDDFAAKAGVPNAFGVVGSAANAIAPGKRMLSSMTPTIALRDGAVALVIGSPGGSTIFTSVFQVMLNLYDFRLPPAQAVAATRYHHQLPEASLIRHDPRAIPGDTVRGLQALGYRVEPNSWGDLGDVQLILRAEDRLQAATDPRGRGVARLISLATGPAGAGE
jgi:gamma-glutamyltranspeptidase/glutathione hydrolase